MQLIQQLHSNKANLDKVQLIGITREQIFSYEDGSLGYKKETISYLTQLVEAVNHLKQSGETDTSPSALSLAARAERR